MSFSDVVEFEGVTKRFDSITAVDGLSFAIPEQSLYGLIGPNGSGKTTTMRMIAGIFLPDSGNVLVLGETHSSRLLGKIGYLPEERGIYKKMTVRRLLHFHAQLRGLRNVPEQVNAWLERLGLAHVGSNPIESLSKGMTQKVQFIAAVIGEPKLLILDEPFSGLDPVSAEAIRAAILDLRRNGATIVLSTHDMGVAEEMCERILMIFRGRKVLDGTLAEIQERFGTDTIRVCADGGPGLLEGLPGVEQVRDLGQTQEIRLARDGDPQTVLRTLLGRTAVRSFSVTKPSLEDIFIRIAGNGAVQEQAEIQSA